MPHARDTIQSLPEHLINQIAAGEVIERPVSVVKELIENSLDACATRIDIEVADGGIQRIAVTDNGCGIPGHEIGAALKRHWTSKISSASDLDSIGSLGFRGEALASIGAVADLSIVTRTDDEAHAWQLDVSAGGEPVAPRPAQGNRGTRIVVSDLFHRIPARRRFLKQPRTEYLHIDRLVRALAFARPEVAFSLSQPGSRGLRLPRAPHGAAAPRWQTVFGRAFSEQAHRLDSDIDGISVTGWVGPAALATNLADTQFIALNGRVIRDKHLQHAIRLAYGDSIATGRFPVYAIALALSPAEVDVNVHPGKQEVRFADVRSVHDVVHATVKQALEARPELPVEVSIATPVAVRAGPLIGEPRPSYTGARSRRDTTPAVISGKPIALIEQRFGLFAEGDGVLVIDLHQAWRDVIVCRLEFVGETETSGRPLLMPQRLPPGRAKNLLMGAPALRACGFSFDDLGAAGAVMRSVPKVLPTLDYAVLLEGLVAELGRGVDDPHAIAAAAAAAINMGSNGQISRAMLDELAHAAAAAEYDGASWARPLTAAVLARMGVDEY